MDVHPPHHGISTWRDFFVHMATICLGLLIALGLEQGVEAVHRAQERNDLRVSLDRDSRQAIVDANNGLRFSNEYIAWLLVRIKQVQAAVAAHQPLPPEPPFHYTHYDLATDSSFLAAKSSGELALLSQEDVRIYSDVDLLFVYLVKSFDEGQTGRQSLRTFAVEAGSVDRAPDYSKLDAPQLRLYLDALVTQLLSTARFRGWSEELVAVETFLLKGNRDLDALHRIAHAAHTPVPGFTPHF